MKREDILVKIRYPFLRVARNCHFCGGACEKGKPAYYLEIYNPEHIEAADKGYCHVKCLPKFPKQDTIRIVPGSYGSGKRSR